jgi:hypothetical protein
MAKVVFPVRVVLAVVIAYGFLAIGATNIGTLTADTSLQDGWAYDSDGLPQFQQHNYSPDYFQTLGEACSQRNNALLPKCKRLAMVNRWNEVLRDLSVESQQYYARTRENIRFVEDGSWFSTLFVDRLESTTNSPHLKKILKDAWQEGIFSSLVTYWDEDKREGIPARPWRYFDFRLERSGTFPRDATTLFPNIRSDSSTGMVHRYRVLLRFTVPSPDALDQIRILRETESIVLNYRDMDLALKTLSKLKPTLEGGPRVRCITVLARITPDTSREETLQVLQGALQLPAWEIQLGILLDVDLFEQLLHMPNRGGAKVLLRLRVNNMQEAQRVVSLLHSFPNRKQLFDVEPIELEYVPMELYVWIKQHAPSDVVFRLRFEVKEWQKAHEVVRYLETVPMRKQLFEIPLWLVWSLGPEQREIYDWMKANLPSDIPVKMGG